MVEEEEGGGGSVGAENWVPPSLCRPLLSGIYGYSSILNKCLLFPLLGRFPHFEMGKMPAAAGDFCDEILTLPTPLAPVHPVTTWRFSAGTRLR